MVQYWKLDADELELDTSWGSVRIVGGGQIQRRIYFDVRHS